jgi:hypothetical protein
VARLGRRQIGFLSFAHDVILNEVKDLLFDVDPSHAHDIYVVDELSS